MYIRNQPTKSLASRRFWKTIFPGLIFLTCCVAIIANYKTAARRDRSSVAFAIDEKDLFPEGIAYDSKTEQFFLSSLSKEKIVAVDKKGKQTDFILSKQDSMLRSLGLHVDVKRRRLWAVSNSDWGDSVISGVHIYDIDSKKLIKKFLTGKNKTPVFNDLILTLSGGAYISDWRGNSIYNIPPDLSKVELFLKSDTLLINPNGITISPDNRFLYAASDKNGIILIDLENKTLLTLIDRSAVNSKSIDGLMFFENTLIGIINGDDDLSKHFIGQYKLTSDGREIVSMSVIDRGNPLFALPTTGVIVGKELYCLAATYVHLFRTDGSTDQSKLKGPMILKYRL